MNLLKALAMPFHLGSLFFVAISSLLMGMILGVGGFSILLALPLLSLIAICLTQYAFKLIDDVTNGRQEAAAVSVDMLSPWGDMRCWVHPLLATAIAAGLMLKPELPRWPVIAGVALLYPASLGAIALSGHAVDAVNPAAMWRVVTGLGWYYPLAVVWIALCAGAVALLQHSEMWIGLVVAAEELLLLLAYAFIGGALYLRRVELGFDPLVSPERAQERVDTARDSARQRMIDGLYTDVRSRQTDIAVNRVRAWLEQTEPHKRAGDLRDILAAGAHWPEARSFANLLRALVPMLVSQRLPALAMTVAEAGLKAAAGFAPEKEADAVALIGYAVQTGRKRLAATMLNNYAATASPGPAREAIRVQILGQLHLAADDLHSDTTQ